MLNQNKLEIYNKNGNKETEIEMEISTPIFETEGNFLCVAEKDGQNIYLISGNNIVWQKKLEGKIAHVSLNKNGYVAIDLKGSTYKSTIQVFDKEGAEILTKYLSSTMVVTIDLSNTNEELAIAKIDYSGITIKSIIEFIDLNKAETIRTHEAEANDLLVNINYQKNNLVCMYDTHINVMEDGNTSELTKFDDTDILFADINLDAVLIEVIKDSAGTSDKQIIAKLINTNNKKEEVFNLKDEPKAIYASKNVICFNLGTELIFISSNGNLKKEYISTEEIQGVVLGNDIAGVIYNNEIEIINL